ncbi:AAA family ATPase [Paraflavitalea soli]|nr:ATP-binding protein [Paraflavitalea soli]
MLDSLAIKNFRNLKDLTIPSLGKVNLITGKNNTGKSAILEAIAIYASRADMGVILQQLEDRGEYYNDGESKGDLTEILIRSFSSLFNNRFIGFDSKDAILIGPIQFPLLENRVFEDIPVSLRFRKYIDESNADAQGNVIFRGRIPVEEYSLGTFKSDAKIGLEIAVGFESFILPLDKKVSLYNVSRNRIYEGNFQFVKTGSLDREFNGRLFDKITLTEKERYVINALKFIEPFTDRIAFVEEVKGKRTAVIKLTGSVAILPLRSMGDGINRIFTIILAMVNAEGGYLLIDEFENGLHYTVQEQLWSIIFKLAQELNIQVFATTHSEDCIAAFSRVLNTPNQTLQGKLIRLDNVNGTIQQVEYNAEELKIATDQNIETR